MCGEGGVKVSFRSYSACCAEVRLEGDQLQRPLRHSCQRMMVTWIEEVAVGVEIRGHT